MGCMSGAFESPTHVEGRREMNVAVASYAFHGLVRSGRMDVFGYLESCKYRYHLRTADIWKR